MSRECIVNVPQGRGARLVRSSDSLANIVGLHTCGFSTCTIITAISRDKAVLIHADQSIYAKYAIEELQWVGEDAVITFHYRIEFAEYSKGYSDDLKMELQKGIPGIKIYSEAVARDKDPILIKSSGSEIIKKVLSTRETPENLIFHPLEQKLLAAHKIEQIIGRRAIIATGKITAKALCIFNGIVWEFIPEHELKINTAHRLSKEELQFFSHKDTFMTIGGKLGGIIQKTKIENPSISIDKDENFFRPIAIWLEGYLNKHDESMLFQRNIRALLNRDSGESIYKEAKPETKEDFSIAVQLVQTLDTSASDWLTECGTLMEEYSHAEYTDFKKQLICEYKTFRRHYDQRHKYRQAKAENKERIHQAKALCRRGVTSMKAGNHTAAKNLFSESLHLVICSVDAPHKKLGIIFFNLGRATQRCGDLANAKLLFSYSKNLKENFDPDYETKWKADLERVISECEAVLPAEAEAAPTI